MMRYVGPSDIRAARHLEACALAGANTSVPELTRAMGYGVRETTVRRKRLGDPEWRAWVAELVGVEVELPDADDVVRVRAPTVA